MRYISTRGASPPLSFAEVALAGLAPDGGLYVPDAWPTLSHAEIAALRDLDYVETAARVIAPFVGDAVDGRTLRDLLAQAYAPFASRAVTPLVQLDTRHWLLELFHGPTLAFKDLGLQLLGHLWGRLLDTSRPLTVIGATSGDTGSAAIAAVAGRPGVSIVMLHPRGRVSEVQRRQMTTVGADNVHNVAVEDDFDGCQALVKAMFNDRAFAARLRLSAVNSINWARLMAQVVYYFYAAVRLGAPERALAFSVPTGNFGDVFAGYVAARMGLPVSRLLVATNENDIVARALAAGDYSRAVVRATQTPSMDIQVSSNFERLLFELHGRDGHATAAAMAGFEAERRLSLSADMRADAALFEGVRVGEGEAAATLRWAHAECGELIDPHTAVGLAAARRRADRVDGPVVTLATAHPAKFPDAVFAASGVRPDLPARAEAIMGLPERYDILPGELAAIEAYVLERAA